MVMKTPTRSPRVRMRDEKRARDVDEDFNIFSKGENEDEDERWG